MIPYEVLYGIKRWTPASWSIPEEKMILGPHILAEMENEVKILQKNLKISQVIQKVYEYKKINFKEF